MQLTPILLFASLGLCAAWQTMPRSPIWSPKLGDQSRVHGEQGAVQGERGAVHGDNERIKRRAQGGGGGVVSRCLGITSTEEKIADIFFF